jgi:hypothetical protein
LKKPLASALIAVWGLLIAVVSQAADVIVSRDVEFSADISRVDGNITLDLNGDIWTLPAGGGQATLVVDMNHLASKPRWSPDGFEILFETTTTDGSDLWIFDRSGNETIQVGSGTYHDQDASWHPGGEQIVFASDRHDTGLDIWAADLSTGLSWRMSHHPGDEVEPAWSEDGRHLVWVRKQQQRYQLMLRRFGEPEFALIESDQPLSSPSWRPDNSLLTYLRHTSDGAVLEMAILSEPLLIRPLSTGEKLFAAPVSWRDRMHMLYTADGAIKTRGFEDRRSQRLSFTAIVATTEPPAPQVIVRRELEVIDPPEGRLVIRGRRLFDGIWKSYRENMDVVVEAGRIVAVESRRDRDDVTVLDLGDVTIMPGLVDAWSALADTPAAGPGILAYGVTTLITDTELSSFDPALWEGEVMPGPRVLRAAADASAVTTSIADSTTTGIDTLIASRQARSFGQAAPPSRRFGGTPALTSLPAPIVAGSKPNRMAPGLALHAELRALAAAGMSGEQTLHAAGKNSAEVLGLANQVGTITPGALADLVLVRGDPLANVSDSLNIVAVVRNGRFFSLVSLLERAETSASVE